jgi:hypothetical protein
VVREADAGDVVPPEDPGALVPPEDPGALADLWEALAADRTRLDVGGSGRAWVTEHANFDNLAVHYLGLIREVVR